MKFLKTILIINFIAMLVGCSSLNKYQDSSEDSTIYAATELNKNYIEGAFVDSQYQSFLIILLPFNVIDMPFSLVFDTLTLPYDLIKEERLKEDPIEYCRRYPEKCPELVTTKYENK